MADDILKPIPERAAFSVLTDQFFIDGLDRARIKPSEADRERLVPLCARLIEHINHHCHGGERLAAAKLLTVEANKPDQHHWAKATTEYARLMGRSHNLADTATSGRGFVGHIYWTRPTDKRFVFYGAGLFGQHDDNSELHTPQPKDFASRNGVRQLLDLGFRQHLQGIHAQNPESRIIKGARLYADTLLFGAQTSESGDYVNGFALKLRINHHGLVRCSLAATSYRTPEQGAAAQSVGIGEGYPAFSTSTLGQNKKVDARHFRWNHLHIWTPKPEPVSDDTFSKERERIIKTRGYISSQVRRLFSDFLRQALTPSGWPWSPVIFEPTLTVDVVRHQQGNDTYPQRNDTLSNDLFGLKGVPTIKVAGGQDLDEAAWQSFVDNACNAFDDPLPRLEPHPREAVTVFGPNDGPVMCISHCPGKARDADTEGSIQMTQTPTQRDEASTKHWLDNFDQVLDHRDEPGVTFDPYTQKRIQLYDSEFEQWHATQNINDTNLTNRHAVRRSFVELSLKNAIAGGVRTLEVSGLPPEMEGHYMGLFGRFPQRHTHEARAVAAIITLDPKRDEHGATVDGVMRVTLGRIETQRQRLPSGPGVTASDREAIKQQTLREAVKKTGDSRTAAGLDFVLARERGQPDRVSVFDDDPFLIDLDHSQIMRCVVSAGDYIPDLVHRPEADLSRLDEAMMQRAFTKSADSAFRHLNMSANTPVAIDTSNDSFARVVYRHLQPSNNTVARNARLRDYQVFDMNAPRKPLEAPEQSRVFALNMRLLTHDYLKAGQTSATSALEKLMRLVVVN